MYIHRYILEIYIAPHVGYRFGVLPVQPHLKENSLNVGIKHGGKGSDRIVKSPSKPFSNCRASSRESTALPNGCPQAGGEIET